MKLIFLISFIAAVLLTSNSGAQTHPASQKSPKPTMKNEADSLKMAMNDAKSSFNTLFKGHKDTTTITISGIEYDDPDFTVLKESIKNLKGIKSVSTEYSSNTMTIKVPFKGKPTDLWDKLPANAKSAFRLVEASDYKMVLENRNKK